MRKHVCQRCRREDQIPTHQLVKFDATVHELCKDCWEGFRAWFFAGHRITRTPAEPTCGPEEFRVV